MNDFFYQYKTYTGANNLPLAKELLSLEPNQRNVLLKNRHTIHWMLSDTHISLKQFLSLNLEMQKKLIWSHYSLENLIRNKISFETLLSLEPKMLTTLLQHENLVTQLICEATINFQEILSSEQKTLDDFLDNYPEWPSHKILPTFSLKILVSEAHIPFKEFISLKEDMQDFLLKNCKTIRFLIKELHFTLKELLSLDQDV